jgi:hypothetical protein
MKRELIVLKRIMLDEDMTYMALGRACGMSDPGLIHKHLHGKSTPTERSLYKIRRFLAAYRRKERERLRRQRRVAA